MRTRHDRGFTLMELVTAMAISIVLTVLVVEALVGLAKDRSSREKTIEAQGEARMSLSMLEKEVRAASLGAGTGVISLQDPANPAIKITRPSVQIYDNVPGGGWLADAKPGTDALLVVEALAVPAGKTRVASAGDQYNSANGIVVTDTDPTQFTADTTYVLFGDYGDAGWALVSAINTAAKRLTLAAKPGVPLAADLFPVKGVQLATAPRAGKLSSGSAVRPARARLYYVDGNDELVRLDLVSPVPPAAAADVVSREVLALAVENLQINCQVDAGTGLGACPGAAGDADAAATFGAGATARVTAGNVGTLRTASLSLLVRSRTPVREQQGDAPISLDGQTLTPSGLGVDPTATYVRRAYQMQIAVRNTSLGVL